MDKITFQRNLIGVEDLLLGTGTVTQVRGKDTVPVTKINGANFPYNDTLSFKDKIDSLETAHYVDSSNLPVYILTPHSSSDLNLTGVLWIKDVGGDERELYYESQKILRYNTVTGELVLGSSIFDPIVAEIVDAYTIADQAITTDMEASLAAAIADRITAEQNITIELTSAINAAINALTLGTAASKNVGTTAGNVVMLDNTGKLPAVDGSQLTNVSAAVIPAGVVVQRAFHQYTSSAAITTRLGNTSITQPVTAGFRIIQETFTPKASGNKLLLRVNGSAKLTGGMHATNKAGLLLFVNNTFVRGAYLETGGLILTNESGTEAPSIASFTIEYEYTATSLSPITVELRAGCINAFNMQLNTGIFNGGTATTLTIEEMKS